MSQARSGNGFTTGQSEPQEKNARSKKLELFFRGLNSENQTLRIPAHKALIDEKVQSKIERRMGYAQGSACLFRYKYNTKDIQLDKPLAEQGVQNHSRIYVLGRLKGD